jgi:hypothetical protein
MGSPSLLLCKRVNLTASRSLQSRISRLLGYMVVGQRLGQAWNVDDLISHLSIHLLGAGERSGTNAAQAVRESLHTMRLSQVEV